MNKWDIFRRSNDQDPRRIGKTYRPIEGTLQERTSHSQKVEELLWRAARTGRPQTQTAPARHNHHVKVLLHILLV